MNRIHVVLAALSFAATVFGGQQNWPSGTEVPDWWPEPVALHPGTTIQKIDHAEEKGLPDLDTLVPTEGATVASIVEWYRASLADAGWEVWDTKDSGYSQSVTSQSKELDRRVIIQVIAPKQMIWNKSEHPRVKITVYREIPK